MESRSDFRTYKGTERQSNLYLSYNPSRKNFTEVDSKIGDHPEPRLPLELPAQHGLLLGDRQTQGRRLRPIHGRGLQCSVRGRGEILRYMHRWLLVNGYAQGCRKNARLLQN